MLMIFIRDDVDMQVWQTVCICHVTAKPLRPS